MIFEPRDEGEIAADYQARHNADALEAHLLAREAAGMARGASLTHCVDCGGKIPERRRHKQKGCTRCVACQSAYEQP